MLMTSAEYRDSLRAYSPRVFVDGQVVDSVADSAPLAPGIAAIGVTRPVTWVTIEEVTSGHWHRRQRPAHRRHRRDARHRAVTIENQGR